ncbi:MAG: dephospho-CoA kinase [Vicinamibacterales bacterium]
MARTVRVALTGGIATGKTYVATRFREAGVPVVDADALSREVVLPGTPGLAAVRKRFGPDAVRSDGTMDRVRIGHLVFRDKRARQDLEGIIHPAVQKAIDTFFEKLPKKTPFAVADIPLLYETGRDAQFDVVVVAACPREMQIERVLSRDRLTKEDAERRLAAQLPIDQKVKRATHVIKTDAGFEATDAQIKALLARLRPPAKG